MTTEILCFVGRLPKRQRTRFLRRIIADVLAQHGFLSRQFADDVPAGPQAFDRLRFLIDRACFCIFEVSGVSRADTFFELGYALGQGTHCILLLKRGERSPTDLAAFEKLEYSSAKQLREGLEKVRIFPPILSSLDSGSGMLNRPLMAAVSVRLLAMGMLDPADVFTVAGDLASSQQQVLFTLDLLRDLGIAEEQGIDWRITGRGLRHLPRLIDELRD